MSCDSKSVQYSSHDPKSVLYWSCDSPSALDMYIIHVTEKKNVLLQANIKQVTCLIDPHKILYSTLQHIELDIELASFSDISIPILNILNKGSKQFSLYFLLFGVPL